VAAGHVELEELLNEIRKERAGATDARQREELARRETEEIRVGLARTRDEIDRERGRILDDARREAERLVSAARRELDRLERKQDASDPRAAAERLEAVDAELEQAAQSANPRRKTAAAMVARLVTDIQPGARIRVGDIEQEGEALGSVGEDGR